MGGGIDVDALVAGSTGFSGAEVSAVCSRAALAAVRHAVSCRPWTGHRIPSGRSTSMSVSRCPT
ncbi:hypothetical protein [Thiocapsa imhoffii]|uniref:hypothetical protein n=1 Tax=Thiocapsa imhoffii TaxID=382777 RepID=UPI001907FD86|nr:hypothetical protein [Thiocapsa imhoffii]